MEYEFSDIPLAQHSKPLGVSHRFSAKTAYGQLILLIFVPICILAVVGAAIVLMETSRAAKAEQQAQAQAILARYEPVVRKLNRVMDSPEGLSRAKQILQSMTTESHLNRAAVIDYDNRSLVHIGSNRALGWPEFDKSRQFVSGIDTHDGGVYGVWAGIGPESPVWLMVEVDNQPMRLAQLKVWLALTVTGLITILLLLLCLNIYAKRWITPIYEMRLHLQRTAANNLYRPMSVVSSGELNLLQRDIVFLLRRLHVSFKELKEYSEQTEDDLRQAFDEMELQTISIRSARDAAVMANEAKSAFLANISHELRTPLNSIDGFINLLIRKEKLTAEQNVYVQTIKKSSAHLLALVNDVLDFSKIEAGKLVLDEHDVDFYAAVYDVVDMLTPQAAEKGIHMAVFYYADVPTHLVSDELRCKQVLTNLVSNALKFTDQGEVVVRVSLDTSLPNGRSTKTEHVVVSIQDTGAGVSEADRKHLFKSFSQGDPSITRQYGGTGLGLVISKQLTRLMGGDIGYMDNSEHNLSTQGSTFWFSVPAQKASLYRAEPSISKPYRVLAWLEHDASMQVLSGLLTGMNAKLTKARSMIDLLNRLNIERTEVSMQPQHVIQESTKPVQSYDWLIVDGAGDAGALLSNIRENYRGKIAAFGYQMALDFDVLARFSAEPLYQPINQRALVGLFEEIAGTETELLPLWQGKTALAVDDHLPNLMVLEALLAELDITTRTVTNGFDAIDAVKSRYKSGERFDIIFMDIQMPRMSGFEAASKIQALKNGSMRTPIIALTAHALADERDKLLASGVDDYVSKPISQPQLVQILKKWLNNAGHIPYKLKAVPKQAVLENGYDNSRHDDASDNLTTDNIAESQKTAQPVFHKTPKVVFRKTDGDSISASHAEPDIANDAKSDEHKAVDLAFDWNDALNRSAGKPALAKDILVMLLDSLDAEKLSLQEAWAKSDIQALYQIAHRLAGGTRYTGAIQLRSTAQVLQQQSLSMLDGNANDIKVKETLGVAYTNVLSAIDALAAFDFNCISDLRGLV